LDFKYRGEGYLFPLPVSWLHPTNSIIEWRIKMRPYKNMSGTSGAVAFEIAEHHIDIKFQDGHTYRYDYTKPGRTEVETMKSLAQTGKGLATFINQHVRERFARKLS
jgi:hypothetical protein